MREDGGQMVNRGVPVPGLRTARNAALLSQRELEERSGIDRSTIAALERGERAAQGRTVRALAVALGVDPARLLGAPGGGTIG